MYHTIRCTLQFTSCNKYFFLADDFDLVITDPDIYLSTTTVYSSPLTASGIGDYNVEEVYWDRH